MAYNLNQDMVLSRFGLDQLFDLAAADGKTVGQVAREILAEWGGKKAVRQRIAERHCREMRSPNGNLICPMTARGIEMSGALRRLVYIAAE